MIFSSVDFFLFFIVFMLLYRVLPHRPQNLMILIASYVFYSWWDWRFTGLIVLMSLVDAIAAIRIGKTENVAVRKSWVAASFSVNLGVLGFFKYFNFFVDTAASTLHAMGLQPHLTTLRLILPVGVSFFTFQSMSYVLDVYRRQTPVVTIYNHMLFVAYYPLLLAGPIERHRHLTQQLMHPRRMTAEGTVRGVILMLWGLFKKVALADNLAPYVNAVYGNVGAHSGASVLLATYLFAFQIYCDFSGYSDMAVGMGRLMGIDIMFNFRSPYLAQNVQEFWRRWHISLSTWFRDYLYLPLGGNRVSRVRELVNLMIVFVVSGFWHGASWAFVIWGGLHGTYMVVWRLLGRRPGATGWGRWLNILITFHLVTFAWIFFRAGTLGHALEVIRALGRPGRLFLDPLLANALLPLALMAVVEIAKDPEHLDEWLIWKPGWFTLGLGLSVATLLVLFAAQAGLQFIYFQF
jgi:D-alanyl-lipoteichoic acid acyltransferase DltB (MBOAT superfamily)